MYTCTLTHISYDNDSVAGEIADGEEYLDAVQEQGDGYADANDVPQNDLQNGPQNGLQNGLENVPENDLQNGPQNAVGEVLPVPLAMAPAVLAPPGSPAAAAAAAAVAAAAVAAAAAAAALKPAAPAAAAPVAAQADEVNGLNFNFDPDDLSCVDGEAYLCQVNPFDLPDAAAAATATAAAAATDAAAVAEQ
jgi:hypothetical protein